MRKLLLLLLISAVLLFSAGCMRCPGNHPMLKVMKNFEPLDSEESVVVPYYVTIMSMDLLRRNKRVDQVRIYIDWYFDHLNYPDKDGLTGSMYDYWLTCNGDQRATEDYDSADSYSATFLMLLDQYRKRTGESRVFERNKEKIYDVAYVMVYLQSDDGLTIAKPKYEGKFLMDNAECIAGLEAFVSLARSMEWDGLEAFEQAKEKIEKAVISELYDSETGLFHWIKYEDGTHKKSSWDTFYPDSLAQLFPIFYGPVPADSQIGIRLWEEYNRRWGYDALEGMEQKLLYTWLSEKFNSQSGQHWRR